MARPRIYKDPVVMTITVERWVKEFIDTAKITIPKALEDYVRATKPRDVSAAEYRIGQVMKERQMLKEDYDDDVKLYMKSRTREFEEKDKELQDEMNMLLTQKSDDMTALVEAWRGWRVAFPKIERPNPRWSDVGEPGNHEKIEFFEKKGFSVTWLDIPELWKRFEKEG